MRVQGLRCIRVLVFKSARVRVFKVRVFNVRVFNVWMFKGEGVLESKG